VKKMAQYEFRQLVETELKDALALVWETFLKFEAPDYTAEGVETFRKFIDVEEFRSMFLTEGCFAWGCFVENKIVGMIALRDIQHVTLFFVKEEYHQLGIGKQLFALAKMTAVVEGAKEMTVNSSAFAVEVYERLGFERTDEMQMVDGIQFLPMKLVL
jgi:GNAT superfamily N-acetyltransferase